jgi:hypothetical protein
LWKPRQAREAEDAGEDLGELDGLDVGADLAPLLAGGEQPGQLVIGPELLQQIRDWNGSSRTAVAGPSIRPPDRIRDSRIRDYASGTSRARPGDTTGKLRHLRSET